MDGSWTYIRPGIKISISEESRAKGIVDNICLCKRTQLLAEICKITQKVVGYYRIFPEVEVVHEVSRRKEPVPVIVFSLGAHGFYGRSVQWFEECRIMSVSEEKKPTGCNISWFLFLNWFLNVGVIKIFECNHLDVLRRQFMSWNIAEKELIGILDRSTNANIFFWSSCAHEISGVWLE